MLVHRRVTTTVAALAVMAFSSTSVLAATEQEITDALKALFAGSEANAELTLGAPTSEGGALVYKDSTLKTNTPDGPGEATIDTITVTGGDINDSGGLVADSLLAEGIDMTSGNETVKIGSAEALNLDVTPKKDGQGGMGKVESITVSDIAVSSPDQPPVKVDTVQLEMGDYSGDYPTSVAFSAEGVEVDVDAAGADDQAAAQLKALGYDKLVLGVYASGSWDEQAGTVTVEDISLEGEDMGSVSFSGVLGGFTPEVVAQLQGSSPSPEVMQNITLSEASLSFSDDSITNKLLDMQASQMGADRAAFVEQISAALPLMLSAIGNPAFQNKLAAAAGTFLKDPQNITVTLAPAQPVDLMTLMMKGQTEPNTLPDLLNAEVKANEPEEE